MNNNNRLLCVILLGSISPNLSGITYRANAPGMTNATMTFKYGAVTSTSKSHISDSISRVYAFNIQPAGP